MGQIQLGPREVQTSYLLSVAFDPKHRQRKIFAIVTVSEEGDEYPDFVSSKKCVCSCLKGGPAPSRNQRHIKKWGGIFSWLWNILEIFDLKT